MPDYVVGPGETARLGRVEGGLKVGHNATIKAESGGKVVVTGRAFFDGGATIDCSFECNAIAAQSRRHTGGTIKVHGDLTVHQTADVADSLEVTGAATADDFDVGGHLTSRSVASKRVRVGGHVRISGALEAESVESGGHLSALGMVKLVNLHAGGHVEVGGGTISGLSVVRGHFSANSSLEYGELQTYGHLTIPAKSKGERLSVLGKVRFDGDTSCKVIDVKGAADVRGNFDSDEVEVFGRLRVSGSLKVSKGFKVLGVADVEQQVECQTLFVEGRLNSDVVFVVGESDLSGELAAVRGIKSNSITVRRGARVSGPLVGDKVEVGEKPAAGFGQFPWGMLGPKPRFGQMTSVEDVYGIWVELGPYSRAKRIFAEEVQMENESIADQVTYTRDLKLPSSYHLKQPPQKTTKLPDPPL